MNGLGQSVQLARLVQSKDRGPLQVLRAHVLAMHPAAQRLVRSISDAFQLRATLPATARSPIRRCTGGQRG